MIKNVCLIYFRAVPTLFDVIILHTVYTYIKYARECIDIKKIILSYHILNLLCNPLHHEATLRTPLNYTAFELSINMPIQLRRCDKWISRLTILTYKFSHSKGRLLHLYRVQFLSLTNFQTTKMYEKRSRASYSESCYDRCKQSSYLISYSNK